jgi:hypothetical protein
MKHGITQQQRDHAPCGRLQNFGMHAPGHQLGWLLLRSRAMLMYSASLVLKPSRGPPARCMYQLPQTILLSMRGMTGSCPSSATASSFSLTIACTPARTCRWPIATIGPSTRGRDPVFEARTPGSSDRTTSRTPASLSSRWSCMNSYFALVCAGLGVPFRNNQ